MADRRIAQLLAAAALLLSACDGYPTEDEPLHNPFHMSPPERVALLNRLSDEVAIGPRWRYGLQDCRLSLERRSWWRGGEADRHDLRGAKVEIRTLEGDEGRRYELLLLPLKGGEAASAFISRKLLDAQRARQLVQLLARDCTRGAQAGTQRSTT